MRILLAILLLLAQADPAADAVRRIDEETLKAHIGFLAADDLEGRAAGFPGNDKAVEYVARTMKDLGLKPAGEQGGYTQEFSFGRGRKARNVLGWIEGADAKLKGEYVLIGGHLDHVGKRGQGVGGQSPGGDPGDEIWNGADDNASGTSAVLAVAKAFVSAGAMPRRSVLICLWNAEEAGLLGSKHWTEHPTRPLDKAVYYLNLDMVGRNPDRPVDLEGVKNAEGDALEKIVTAACDAERLRITKYDHHHEAMFRSDGVSFLWKEIPASMFFTSWHDDYHRVGDHADKIAYANLAKIGRAAYRIVRGVADREERLKFNMETPLSPGSRKQLGVQGDELAGGDLAALKLGVGEGGYRVTAVTEGGTAEGAGIKARDVIVGFSGKPLPASGTLSELRRRIQATKRGEEVDVEILRGGERVHVKAVWPKA